VRLHRLAFRKLRERPDLRSACLDLVQRWLDTPAQSPSRPWLLQWREMLTDWSIERIERTVLDPDEGQTLRQCPPLGPAVTPQERWAVLADADPATTE
jgi:hypothetical protein